MNGEGALSRRGFLSGGVAAAVAGGSVLAGCSGGPQSTTPPGWTEVTFSSIGDAKSQQMFQDMIAAAQTEALDELKIKIIWKPAPGDGWDSVMLQFASGTVCDVQRIDDDRVYALAVDNKIHQLDPFMLDPDLGWDLDAYSDSFATKVAVEGYQFSITPAVSANVVIYNKALFAKAGLQAPTSWADAWEWDEFIDAAHRVTTRNGDRTDVYGVQFAANVVQPCGYGAGDVALNEDQTECGFTKPETERVIDGLVQLIRGGFAPTVDVDTLPLFNAGKLAMCWQPMDVAAQLNEDIDWDVMPWPKSPLYAATKNYARTWVIPKTAKDPQASFLALKALSGPAASEVLAKTRSAVPMLTAAAESAAFTDHDRPTTPAVWSETLDSVDKFQVDIPMPRGPIGDAFAASFVEGPLANGLLAGKLEARDYLQQGRQRVNDEIKRRSWNTSMGMEQLSKGALEFPDKKVLDK